MPKEDVQTIYLVGDSTMADYSGDYDPGKDYMKVRYPVTGWGQVFQQFFAKDSLSQLQPLITSDSVFVDDRARGGRSTRTFFQEGRWRSIYENLKPKDLVVIQFGHNDASENHPLRYVDIEGYKEFLRLFIDQARQKDAVPILLTPVARNYPWENDHLQNVHGAYPDAVKEIAKEMGVPVIDLNQDSMDYFSKKGKEYVTQNYFMNLPAGKYEAYPKGQNDNTHFQPDGAKEVAQLVFDGLKQVADENRKQIKIEPSPYAIATTYEKLKKDYPFIKPITEEKPRSISAKENLVYKKTETSALKLDVYSPAKRGKKIYPGVLLIHGGGWASGSKENERIMAQHLAENGYVGVAVQYRLSEEAKYPAAVIDLKDALRWMRENAKKYHIDPDKIAVLGASAGAQLATLVGVTPDSEIYLEQNKGTSSKVQAIVNIDGIVSFIHPEAAAEGSYAGYWLGGLKDINYKNWKEASPLEYVDENTPPTLFMNSSQPRFYAGRDDMIKILDENGIYSEVHTLEDSPHSFWLMHPWFETTLAYTVSFLDKILKNSENK